MRATRDSELADEAGQNLSASRELRRGRRTGDHGQRQSSGVRSRLYSQLPGGGAHADELSLLGERRVAPANVLGLSCASNMLPPGREPQGERPGSLQAYRDSSKPGL